jgi:hypothetical protein
VSRFRLALLVGACALSILAVGCGSSDGGMSEEGAAEPTKATYIKAADAICTNINRDEIRAISGLKHPSSLQELRALMPVIRREVREIAALEPPPGEEAEVKAFVSAYQEAAKEPIANVLDGKSEKYETAFKLMQSYGFRVCGVS